jgi:hypothetical protein
MSDKYCTHCYTTDELYAFGFCGECWVKEGKPKAMDGSTIQRG